MNGASVLRAWLTTATELAVLAIDAMALVIIVVATVKAFASGLRASVLPPTAQDRRDIWLRFARSLVAGLTFLLAADILETTLTTSWESVGRIAAMAVIRTFLNHFLDHDLSEVRARQEGSGLT